jgi:alpha-glucosidase (family GH31 glycosyl hydrolase)
MAHRRNFPTEPKANAEAVIGGGEGCKYRLTVLTEGLVRYEYAEDCTFEDRASTFAINRKLPVPKFRLVETDTDIEIITEKFHLRYDKGEFSPNGFTVQCRATTSWHSLWRYGDNSGGLGGTARTLDEANGRIPVGPGVVSKQGYVALDDSDTMLFTGDGWVSGRKPGNRIDGYVFAYGHDYAGAIKAFYAVSGKQPLLPRWTLGNWWSRYYKYEAQEYLDLLDKFREEGIPLSVGVLDMDWHLVEDERVKKSGMSGWTGYTWDKTMFPDPKAFLAECHKRKLKMTLNVHPADGIASYEEAYEEMADALGKDKKSGDPIAFDITDPKFHDAYFDILHHKLEDEGVDFWWLDWQQGRHSRIPGVDPLWMLNHYHFLDSARGGGRPITFSRYAGPGSHRYPVGFSGDTVVTWESLDFQPEFTATASNIGYAWWSHDIGELP